VVRARTRENLAEKGGEAHQAAEPAATKPPKSKEERELSERFAGAARVFLRKFRGEVDLRAEPRATRPLKSG